jgi:hypothetical protein
MGATVTPLPYAVVDADQRSAQAVFRAPYAPGKIAAASRLPNAPLGRQRTKMAPRPWAFEAGNTGRNAAGLAPPGLISLNHAPSGRGSMKPIISTRHDAVVLGDRREDPDEYRCR